MESTPVLRWNLFPRWYVLPIMTMKHSKGRNLLIWRFVLDYNNIKHRELQGAKNIKEHHEGPLSETLTETSFDLQTVNIQPVRQSRRARQSCLRGLGSVRLHSRRYQPPLYCFLSAALRASPSLADCIQELWTTAPLSSHTGNLNPEGKAFSVILISYHYFCHFRY